MLAPMATAASPDVQDPSAEPGPDGPVRTLSVAMTIGSFRPVLGGAQLQLERLAPLLRARGVTPTVLTRRPPGTPARETVGGTTVVRLPAPPGEAAASLSFATAATAAILRRPPAVIHAHGLLSAATAALAAGALTGRPVVAKVLATGRHGDLARLASKPGGVRRLALLRRHVAAFACVTAEVEAELRAHGIPASRLVRIPNGVDAEHFRPAAADPAARPALRAALGLPVHGPLAVSCGRLVAEKRLDRLVLALVRAPGDLVLLGDGPEAEALRRLARSAGVGDRLHVRPTVADPAPALRAADVYVTCSAQDGLSNAVLEAMACGLPVVAARAGGMAELVDASTGVPLETPSPAAVADALTALDALPDRGAALGAAGRRRVVERYALAVTADRLTALYRRLDASRG